jgi:hypothetical protein
MSYFKELPNLQYLSRLPDSDSNENYITVKNIFKRAAIRNDIINVITAFVYYEILDNERPEQIANKVYNNSELDWVILHTNNITNIRQQWPLSNYDLYNYMLEKYGSDENISNIHHHETTEVLDNYNRVVIPAGLKVDSNFTITYSKTDYSRVTLNPTKQVTNYEYETSLNEDKRKIRVLKPDYLSVMISDLKNSMKYGSSSDYINQTNKSTYNPRLTGV